MNQEPKRKYDSSIARMAGNIAAGFVGRADFHATDDIIPSMVKYVVDVAESIVEEIKRRESVND